MNLMMMTNLFENFDPSTNNNFSLNWLFMLYPLILMMTIYWMIPSRIFMMMNIMLNKLYIEFKLISKKAYQSNILMFISFMMFIMLLNLFSLMPHIFTITSHMSFNFSLALTLWFSFFIFMWTMNIYNSLKHLVPDNCPMYLMNFMVLIELISNLIRPLTLTIRLTANLISGHLLLTLLSSFISNINIFIMIPSILIQNILLILEISMAFIQSYVFSILMMLYFSESK